jgi:DNA-binding response OmpR family regulator
MDELQQFFRDSVVDQIHTIERLLGPIVASDAEAITHARRVAHNLKGAGSSYGYPEITQAAALVEKAADDDLERVLSELCITLTSVTTASARRSVLVIDDDPLITRLLEARLTTPGRRVTSMASLQAARQYLMQSSPDLILLDLFLPDGDGRTLLRDLRHDERTAGIPVIVISAADSPEVREEMTALGADGFAGKPFLADEVAALIAATMQSGKEAGTGRSALTASYRTLLERQVPITVVAVLPETHGPGGKRSDGPDPSVSGEVHAALLDVLGPETDVAEWADGELAIVSSEATAQLWKAIDRARLKLRTLSHPSVDGAVVSLSAGIVAEDGQGLTDAWHRAQRFALDANRVGGDRVSDGRAPHRGGRILLAEDDTLTAALVLHRLEREGFEVVHESDGTAALELAEEAEWAVIVLDVQLPGIDGFRILERLRSQPTYDETPIVMLTAADSEREVVRGFELGANDYILKPFSPAEFTARLKRFVRP